ncbi:MAG: hypothetical protein ACOH5I_16575 [Oligoflexus sp.]
MKILKLIFCITMFMSTGLANAQIVELRQRCEEDNLTPAMALERFNWLKTCHPDILTNFHDLLFPEFRSDPADLKIEILADEWLFARGRLRSRPKYLTFGHADNSNPLNWQAPTSERSACGIPAGYIPLGVCTSSCYHPSQVVLFEQGEIPMGEAYDEIFDRIVTVSDDAALDALDYTVRPVEAYTRSIRDTDHDLLRVTMKSGGQLLITPNHPMLRSDGIMVEAQELAIGQALVTETGTHDAIVSMDYEPYFGKVYNVAPNSSSLKGHILVAEGYLTGSSWYQNDGYDYLNRLVMRNNIPDELLD